jgi:acetyl/propionyl-CoA carboxylase alpha subunit
VRRGPGRGIRAGAGSAITPHYDSLLAKLIASGADREEALERLAGALAELRLLGVTTNAGFLERLLADPAVRAGELDTGLVERHPELAQPGGGERTEAAIAVAALEALALHEAPPDADPWDSLVGFRIGGPAPQEWQIDVGGDQVAVSLLGAPEAATVSVDGRSWALSAQLLDDGRASVALDGRARVWDHAAIDRRRWVACGPGAFAAGVVEPLVEGLDATGDSPLEAPMPGTVLDVRVAPGDAVAEGDVLVVVESMKMELTLTAPAESTVAGVLVAKGDGVKQGQVLVELGSGE